MISISRRFLARFLANNLTAAKAVEWVARLFTDPVRRKNVVMMHIGRCGSTVIGMMLDQHPKISWAGEIFENSRYKYGSKSWIFEKPLQMITLRSALNKCEVFGLEMKDGHFYNLKTEVGEINDVMECETKYIILKRRNYLGAKVSALVAKKIGKWSTEKEISPPKVRVPITYENGDSLLDKLEKWDKFYNDMEKIIDKDKYLKITYEDDIKNNPKRAYKKIIQYLNLSEEKAEVKTKKINKRPLNERVKNFDEIIGLIGGTEYEWMIK